MRKPLQAGGGIELFPPAKINLFLEVLFKRADGFHEICSLVHKIPLFDRLGITPSKSFSFTCDFGPSSDSNIVVKAFRLFEMTLGKTLNFKIELEKKIPMEAGLGGGSSDAAALLVGLNTLLGDPLNKDQLLALGSSLGSDVPLFIYEEDSLLIGGRGERVLPASQTLFSPVTLFFPPFGLPTKKVYEGLTSPQKESGSLESRLREIKAHSYSCFNDLEESAFAIEPRLLAIKQQISSAGYKSVTMTGSGSTFFGFGEGNSSKLDPTLFFTQIGY